jgi:hypothetical protein
VETDVSLHSIQNQCPALLFSVGVGIRGRNEIYACIVAHRVARKLQFVRGLHSPPVVEAESIMVRRHVGYQLGFPPAVKSKLSGKSP